MSYKVPPDSIPQWEALNRALQALQAAKLDTVAKLAGVNAILKEMDSMKIQRGNKPRKPYTLDSPQFSVAVKYVTGEIRYSQAVEMLCELGGFSDVTIPKKHLKEMKPRATSFAILLGLIPA